MTEFTSDNRRAGGDNLWRDLECDRQERDQLLALYTKALCLLSDCSVHAPDVLKEQIEDLVHETGRTTSMPVRTLRFEGRVVIDAIGIPG